jgi:hypothetical protein
MGINEDREEFNNSGLRGLLKEIMKNKDEAFIRILDGGWRGEEVKERPAPGTGPYLHFRRGAPVLEFSNSSPDDESHKEFRVEV